jgi:methyltransferase family protein
VRGVGGSGGGLDDFDRRLREFDIRLFRSVQFVMSGPDRIALMALHNACREVHGTFCYLEVGSYLGGSLQVFLADPRCVGITSIDARHKQSADIAGNFVYRQTTTEQMLEGLTAVPGADLGKLRTFDDSVEGISTEGLTAELCFVDGEHTHDAALRDARFCRAVSPQGTIAFHDCTLVKSAIEAFAAESQPCATLDLPGEMFAVELGPPRILQSASIRRLRDQDLEWAWKPPAARTR